MIYKMTLKDSADEITFNLLEVPIVDKDIEGAVDNVTLDGNQYTDYLWLKKQYIQKWSLMCEDEYSRLRGFYTRQFDEGTVPTYRLYYGDDIISYGTAEGKRINFTITGIEASMALDTVKGGTEQPSYTGKNLSYVSSINPSSVGSWASTGGSIKNTAYTGSTANLVLNMATTNLSANETAYVSCDIRLVSGTASFSKINDNAVNYTSIQAPTISSSFKRYIFSHTYDSAKTFSTMLVQFTNLTNGVVEVKNVMVAKSNADYEPYVGGIPAPNPNYPQPIETVTGRQTIGIVSKNLYDPNSTVFANSSLVSVGVEGDVVKATALANTTSGDLFWRTPIPDGLLEDGKTYTASSVLGSGAYRGLKLQLRNRDGSNAGFSNGYTVTYDSRYTLFVVENPFSTQNANPVTAGTVCVISNIQVEEGGSETTFESFHEQEQEINLGKNLWDTTIENGFIDNSGVQQSSTNQMRTVGYIELAPNTSYTFSNTNGLVVDRVCYYDGAKTFIERSGYINNKTFTTTSTNFQLARIVIRATNGGDISPSDLAEPQLEKGYDATSYSAYFTPIELCKIGTYQDKIYKENGKWWLHKEIGKAVLDGSADENWTTRSGATTYAYSLADVFDGNNASGLSDHFRFIQGGASSGQSIECIASASTSKTLNIFTNDGSLNTVANLKTWLANNNVSVYYSLATPTTTEITDATLLEQLNHAYSLYIGENNILSVTPNLMPEIKIAYTEIFEKSTDIIPETAVRLTLTDGGVINACGCRKDVQLTMRETIE